MTPDDKTIVREYFNTTGFERWQRIYGDGKVNRVQAAIRRGHQRTVDAILERLGKNLVGQRICDAGCGVGSLSIPLAERGAKVLGADISKSMVEEAQRRWQTLNQTGDITFMAEELELIKGKFEIVICVDVLIHYPLPQATQMLTHLSELATERLIFTFAPQTFWLNLLKKIGQFFPGASKATRAYQHREQEIVAILKQLGWQVSGRVAINESFYFARLLDCTRNVT